MSTYRLLCSLACAAVMHTTLVAQDAAPRPAQADPAFERWRPLLEAHKARAPRPIPNPLPAVALVPGPFSAERTDPAWRTITGPQWLYDGTLGIGLHWGPASLEGRFAWPAWARYGKDRAEFDAKYGHPSNMGWKDIANLWRAEKFDAMKLGAFFKANGFCFVAAQAAHHDRFDVFDSTYRPWNSVNVGPHRDILKEWREACLANGLRFGITDHSDWQGHMGGAFERDKDGPWAGIPFDGLLTRADGKGKWWEGLDPVDFYGPVQDNSAFLDRQWYLRSIELIRNYQPDIWWQDGNFHNLQPEMARLFIPSYYNLNAAQHGGKPEGVMIIKQHPSTPVLMTNYEIHRSVQSTPHPWMTDTTCYGPWFYDKSCEQECIYTGESLVQFVVDIISRNGTLLLNVTLRPDGTLPRPQEAMLEDFGRWMAVNREAIVGTKPWHVFCDNSYSRMDTIDPSAWATLKPGTIRYLARGDDTVYAIHIGIPKDKDQLKDKVLFTQLNHSYGSALVGHTVTAVSLLGSDEQLTWAITNAYNLDATGLEVVLPKKLPCDHALVFKVTLAKPAKP